MKLYQVDQNLSRGARPLAADIAYLKSSGFERIISLESGFFEASRPAAEAEREIAASHGIYYQNVALNPIAPPSLEQVKKALVAIRNHRKTFVHCLEGVDRTGVVCAAYRIVYHCWPAQRAIAEMMELGFHWGRYFWWLPSIRKLLTQLEKEKACLNGA